MSWIELCGTRYTSGDIVVATSDLLPQFGIIQEIIVDNLCYYFVLELLHTICFSTHFHSFEVINNSPPVFSVIKPSDLFDHCVLGLYHIQSHRSFFVPLKYFLIEQLVWLRIYWIYYCFSVKNHQDFIEDNLLEQYEYFRPHPLIIHR